MLSLFTLRSLLRLSKRTYEFRLTGSSTPGRTASRSQPQLADLVEDRFGRAGPTRLHIMTSGQTTRPRATGPRSTSIMLHGSRFGQSRSPIRSGSPPAPPGVGPARRHPARLARPATIAFRPPVFDTSPRVFYKFFKYKSFGYLRIIARITGPLDPEPAKAASNNRIERRKWIAQAVGAATALRLLRDRRP